MELILRDLVCERGGRTVFAGLSLSVAAGEMLTLRGPNGAGKTSLLRSIAGLTPAAAGTVRLDGGDDGVSVGQQAHYIGHANAIKPQLSVAENLRFWAAFHGAGTARIEAAMAAMDLTALAPFDAALLSAGQKRRLALARLALIERPVWLLDEPTVGLDTASVGRLQALMRSHLDGGGIILAATHIDLGMARERVFDFGTPATEAAA
ncbi:MAG TPA: heme ABC exporter ATP-binding protein CcmA [Thermopetrobacter sp.]|nr:heme ABC exporter ATP-binding protein CcmA [Thermopetrobacter sp.]